MSAIASSSRITLLHPIRQVLLSSSRYASTAPATAPPTTPRRRRSQDPPRTNVDLIAPPDPISNIRPVIYASKSTRPTSSQTPYSTSEFPYSASDASMQDLELEWRLMRERVDLQNHRFWGTINLEFNAQLQNRLSQLPTPSDPPTPEDILRKEECMSRFYADWQAANRDKQTRWVRQWWSELWAGLRMQGRVYIARMMRR